MELHISKQKPVFWLHALIEIQDNGLCKVIKQFTTAPKTEQVPERELTTVKRGEVEL